MAAAGPQGRRFDLVGAPHYADDRPDLVDLLADQLLQWAHDPATTAHRAAANGSRPE